MADLAFNPHVELTVRRAAGEVTGVTVAAPVKGRPLRVVTFTAVDDPAIVDLLSRVAAGRDEVSADLAESDWQRLAEAGVLAPEDLVTPPPRLRCALRDSPRPPSRDVPQSLPRDEEPSPVLAAARRPAIAPARPDPNSPPRDWPPGRWPGPAPSGPLHVNPSLRFEEERPPAPGPFARDCAWASVNHPDIPVPSLLSVDEPDRDLFRRLCPGEPEPANLLPPLREALFAADVLVDPAALAARRDAWTRSREAAREELARDRYTAVHNLLHPSQIAALRRYFRDLVEGGRARFDDRQVPLRFWMHNEPVARFFHHRLAQLVSDLAGEPMKPSYVFFASYRPGAVLSPHRDRAQCALSISLLLDYEPLTSAVSPWPLWLGLDAEAPSSRVTSGDRPRAVAIEQSPGDALLYRGTELSHWRHPLPEGHTSTSLFLHYVPAAFDGPLD